MDRMCMNLPFCKRDMAIAALWGYLYLLLFIVSTTLQVSNLLFLQLENKTSDLKSCHRSDIQTNLWI